VGIFLEHGLNHGPSAWFLGQGFPRAPFVCSSGLPDLRFFPDESIGQGIRVLNRTTYFFTATSLKVIIASDRGLETTVSQQKVNKSFRIARRWRLVAPSANFAISAAIALAFFAELFLMEARLPQFSTVGSVPAVVMVRIYSHAARPKLNGL